VSADARGVWWGAWVLDETSGVETYLGKLQVGAAETSLSGHANFSEYYGPPVAAPRLVPQSTVLWSIPGGDEEAPSKYRFTATFKEGTKARGTTGAVTEAGAVETPQGKTRAVRIVEGG
jgi:hypothetical protein